VIRAIPWRLPDLRPLPKNYFQSWTGPEKFLPDPFIKTRVIELVKLDRQTDRQTDTHTHRCSPSHPYMDGLNFYALFDAFHFTSFILLTPSTKD
jgi:hypothetical protein